MARDTQSDRCTMAFKQDSDVSYKNELCLMKAVLENSIDCNQG